jgi:hypothetical protein
LVTETARKEQYKKILCGHIGHEYDRPALNAGYIMMRLAYYGRLYFMVESTQTRN